MANFSLEYPHLFDRISHGTATVDATDPSALRAAVTCDPGYKVKGPEAIVCEESGAWSQPLPSCVRRFCEKPPLVINGNVRVSEWFQKSLGSQCAKLNC